MLVAARPPHTQVDLSVNQPLAGQELPAVCVIETKQNEASIIGNFLISKRNVLVYPKNWHY